MYCSSCGVAVAQSLSYCNYCGEKLNDAKGEARIKSSEVKPEMLVAAMVFVFVLGLGAITVLMGVMKAVLNFDLGLILAFTLLSFLVMLSIEGVIVRLLLRRKRGTEEAGDNVPLKGQATKELDAAPARVLPEPVPSVTEHTTRAFEPIYSERTSK
jgi:predicted amidophosphoribosyltransferase